LMYMTSGHGCAASATGASGMTRVVPDVEPGTSANIATTSTTAVVSLFSVTSSWSPTSTTSTRPLSTAAGAPDSVGPDSAANTSGRPGADAVTSCHAGTSTARTSSPVARPLSRLIG